jgi:hypothetical protein
VEVTYIGLELFLRGRKLLNELMRFEELRVFILLLKLQAFVLFGKPT